MRAVFWYKRAWTSISTIPCFSGWARTGKSRAGRQGRPNPRPAPREPPDILRLYSTNAVTEGFNSKIQSIKANARGFRNFQNYRIAILFHCGKLDLQPL